jgi:hypothetical protein
MEDGIRDAHSRLKRFEQAADVWLSYVASAYASGTVAESIRSSASYWKHSQLTVELCSFRPSHRRDYSGS